MQRDPLQLARVEVINQLLISEVFNRIGLRNGYGVRGPQRPISTQDYARPAEMLMGVDNSTRPPSSPSQEGCDPGGGADTGIKYIKATQWDSGTSKWKCVWLPTCPSTCDTV